MQVAGSTIRSGQHIDDIQNVPLKVAQSHIIAGCGGVSIEFEMSLAGTVSKIDVQGLLPSDEVETKPALAPTQNLFEG